MALEIVLYDRSPVVHKIFSHVLYHYAPVIYRTDQTKDFTAKIQSHKPDLVFIDYSISQELEKKLSDEIASVVQHIPVILLSKQDIQGESVMPYKAKDYLKKPIDATRLKELIDRFVPKAKSHLLKEHLIFPPMPDFDEDSLSSSKAEGQHTDKEQDFLSSSIFSATASKSIDLPKTSSGIEMDLDSKSEINISPARAQFPSKEKSKADDLAVPSKSGLNVDDSDGGMIIQNQVSKASQSSHNKLPPKPGISIDMATDSEILIKQSGQASKSPAKPKPQGDNEVKISIAGLEPGPISKTNKVENAPVQETVVKQGNEINSIKKTAVPGELGKIKEELVREKPISVSKEKDRAIQEEPKSSHKISSISEESIQQHLKVELEKKISQFLEKEAGQVMQKAAERAVWQVVPELAKQLIEKELEKILKETKSQSN